MAMLNNHRVGISVVFFICIFIIRVMYDDHVTSQICWAKLRSAISWSPWYLQNIESTAWFDHVYGINVLLKWILKYQICTEVGPTWIAPHAAALNTNI